MKKHGGQEDMNKKEFKERFFALLEEEVNDFSPLEKVKVIRDFLVEYEKEIDYDTSNKGNEWTDDELKVVLSFAPTKENCIKLAKAFKRGYGSIEQIYRWAVISDKDLKNSERKDDKFINQIKRVYKEMGWRA